MQTISVVVDASSHPHIYLPILRDRQFALDATVDAQQAAHDFMAQSRVRDVLAPDKLRLPLAKASVKVGSIQMTPGTRL